MNYGFKGIREVSKDSTRESASIQGLRVTADALGFTGGRSGESRMRSRFQLLRTSERWPK